MTRRPSNACEEVLRALTPSSGDSEPSSSSSSPVASFLSSALSQIQQPGPSCTSSRSLLSISSGSGEQEEPPISPLLVGAGKLLLENWQPILQVHHQVKSTTLKIITTGWESCGFRKGWEHCNGSKLWFGSNCCCWGWSCHCGGCKVCPALTVVSSNLSIFQDWYVLVGEKTAAKGWSRTA